MGDMRAMIAAAASSIEGPNNMTYQFMLIAKMVVMQNIAAAGRNPATN